MTAPSVAVVMPFRGEARFRVASWIRQRLELLHPDWRLHVGVDGGEPWTKARAVNRAVPARADVIVVIDADCAVPARALEWAVAWVADGASWAVPFSMVYRLTEDQTARVLAGPADVEVEHVDAKVCIPNRPPYDGTPGGGVFAVSRDAWATVGGFDERFVWGQEDCALGRALDTMTGVHRLLPAPLWHLWHPFRPVTRAMYDDHRLEARYIAAHGHPEPMGRLVRETSGLDARAQGA